MSIEQDRIIASTSGRDDEVLDRAVRPKTLADYVGQPKVKTQMEIFIQAARQRGEAFDHVLIFGPPGLGKTTLADIVAHELRVNLGQGLSPTLDSGSRGSALPGDGRLAMRSHDGRGPRLPLDHTGPGTLYLGMS